MNPIKKVLKTQPTYSHKDPKNGRDIYRVEGLRGRWRDEDMFVWTAPDDSDITISFTKGNDPLNVGPNKFVERGKTFSKRLKDIGASELPAVSKASPYCYTIFIHKSRTYAECLSEPEVIIDE